jgi:nitrate reductase / nitrite oxidoreductase, beta subunit
MNVRAQISSVFHLDKCIGCHTCSVACKNQWTDRKGVEYAWWNNVETKPGAGYPVCWEDQEKHQGGWKVDGGRLALRQAGKAGTLARLFHNPGLPVLQDY